MTAAFSIGIIGGTDGPTAIFVAGRFPWEILLISVLLTGFLIWFTRKKK